MNYQKIQINNGTVIVPDDFEIIKETLTNKAEYAGIVTFKNRNATHFVVFSDHPVNDMSAVEEERLHIWLKELLKINPDIELATFAIPEAASEQDLFLGTGIIRRARQ